MTDAQLKAEIESGPLAATLAAPWAAGNDTETARLLNDATLRTRPRDLPHGEFVGWMIMTDTIDAVEAARDGFTNSDATTQATVRQVCRRAVRVFETPALEVVFAADLTPLVGLLATVAVVTEEVRDSLTARLVENCSRATELGWSVTHTAVAAARNS
jgi:hypothetical protein